MSTSGGYHEYIGDVEYIGGGGGGDQYPCIGATRWRSLGDIMSTWADVQYIREIS